MKVNNNNINFKSNIVFVSPKGFERVAKKFEKNPNYENIEEWYIVTNKLQNRGFRTDVEDGYTLNIRSCSAGLCAKKEKPAPFFWHIYHSNRNYKNLGVLEEFLEGDNALIVGGKSGIGGSMKIFNKILHMIENKHMPVTILKNQRDVWESQLAYRSKNDTFYLCVNDATNMSKYVKSMSQLQKVFKKVVISPTDNIKFLNRFQELLLLLKR